MLDTALILAGGFGTRLRAVVNDIPKPMAPVAGKPFLTYLLSYLQHFGFKKVILSVGFLSEKIMDHYGENFGRLDLVYSVESQPLGTGGAIRLGIEHGQMASVLVLNGDSFFDLDLNRFILLHRQSGAHSSLALRRVNDPGRYGTVNIDSNNLVTGFSEKDKSTRPGLINAGVYALDCEKFMARTKPGEPFSVEKDYFTPNIGFLDIRAFEFEGYFIDIGIPEDYAKAQNDFKKFKY